MFRMMLVVVAVSGNAIGATTAAQQATAIEANGTFFALSVKDLDVSTRWYVEKFGLTIGTRSMIGDASSALLSGKGLEIELIAFKDSVPRRDPFDAQEGNRQRGIVKVGFEVPNFERTITLLRSRGVEIVLGPFPPRKDQRANVLIRDNEGNLIQLFGGFAKLQ